MDDIFLELVFMMEEVVVWFDQLLDATGLKGIYLGYVFVAMATGFLLKRFGSGLSLGSDKADNRTPLDVYNSYSGVPGQKLLGSGKKRR